MLGTTCQSQGPPGVYLCVCGGHCGLGVIVRSSPDFACSGAAADRAPRKCER